MPTCTPLHLGEEQGEEGPGGERSEEKEDELGGPAYLYRYGVGWLLLGECQKAPKGDCTAEWAYQLAKQIAREGTKEESSGHGQPWGDARAASAYDVELYGVLPKGKGAFDADEATRRFFFLDKW